MTGQGIIPDLTSPMYQPEKRASRITLPRGISIPRPARKNEHWRERRFKYLRETGRIQDLIKEFGHS